MAYDILLTAKIGRKSQGLVYNERLLRIMFKIHCTRVFRVSSDINREAFVALRIQCRFGPKDIFGKPIQSSVSFRSSPDLSRIVRNSLFFVKSLGLMSNAFSKIGARSCAAQTRKSSLSTLFLILFSKRSLRVSSIILCSDLSYLTIEDLRSWTSSGLKYGRPM
jgi:hypothetical protein